MIGWDRGRPARKRAGGAQFHGIRHKSGSRFALICGRDARGPSQSLDPFTKSRTVQLVEKVYQSSLAMYLRTDLIDATA